MRFRASILAACLAALAITGCGERKATSTQSSGGQSRKSTPTEEGGKAADPAAVRVIRGWADAQRASNLDRASSFFAVPSVVSNGSGPERLTSRADARRFNEALPCGAELLRTTAAPRGRYTIATFRLVSRPGARCDGTGAQARTAFEIRDGKIRTWVRVADSGQSQPPSPSPPEPDNRAPDDGGQTI